MDRKRPGLEWILFVTLSLLITAAGIAVVVLVLIEDANSKAAGDLTTWQPVNTLSAL